MGMKQLTGEGLKTLMSRSLKHLSLQGSTGITDTGLSALIRNCPNVEKLCLAELDKLTDTTFICLAEVLGDRLVRQFYFLFLLNQTWHFITIVIRRWSWMPMK